MVSRRGSHVRVRFPQGVLRGAPEPGEAFFEPRSLGEGTRTRGRGGGRGRASGRRAQPFLPRQRVLLFVASDVDALCACKILQVRPAGWAGAGRGGGAGRGPHSGRELVLGRGLKKAASLAGRRWVG